MPDAGPGGARDDVPLPRGDGRLDQATLRYARHRLVDARRDAEVADGDLGSRVGQRLGLARVAHQHADGRLPPDKRAHGFGADLPGRRYEDHDVVPPAGDGLHSPLCPDKKWAVKPRMLIASGTWRTRR